MIKESVTLDEVISYLNEIILLDSRAITLLGSNLVPCNKTLAEHPTVGTGKTGDRFYVGLIGIINGMFGVDENKRGAMGFVFEHDSFVKVIRASEAQSLPSSSEVEHNVNL